MKKQKDIFHISIKQKIWGHTILISIFLYIFFLLFTYLVEGKWELLIISKALAGTSAILFGASFSLSGFCYYFDFLDHKICYRKYLGLAGFWFALFYSISLTIADPTRYLFGFFDNFFTADIFYGTVSMIIFTFIAIISNDKTMIKMGPKLWRKLMRLGYVAWTLLVVRAWFIEKDLWSNWLNSYQGFPPPRLLLSFFVLAVIVFRLSIELNKYLETKQKKIK